MTVDLRRALDECARAMHDYAVESDSDYGVLHTATDWTVCTGPECVAARAALEAPEQPTTTYPGPREYPHTARALVP